MLGNNNELKKEGQLNLDYDKLPQHIAIIMDGNGRWATMRNMPRTVGHRNGVKALRNIIRTSSDLNIKYLTLYAFSTENWKRPKSEVSALMKLLIEYLRKEIGDLNKNNVKINTIGDITRFPENVLHEINIAKSLTNNNNGLNVNIALNYGGRDEIVRAIKKIGQELLTNNITINNINEELINNNLDAPETPDPDLLIRTGGEYRLSNFLLWQCAYTEFWVTDVYWPDFTENHLIQAIYDFQNRNRRFGGL
ncbi:MAG: isoprenyl transferase [Clostridiales bacterium]|nr:isoprenyl transferase [Clostridiales bacterium]